MTNLIKKKNKLFLLAFVTLLLFSFIGCTSTLTPKLNGITVEEKNYNNPQDSALLFGFISKTNPGLNSKNLPVDKFEFVQINPDIAPMFIAPGNSKNDQTMNYTQPVPVGSVFKITSWDDKIGMIKYGNEGFLGLGGIGGYDTLYGRIYPAFDQSIIISASKPGLYYYGSYLLDKDRKNFVIDKNKTELGALKLLIEKYKNTPWENIIMNRIKEIEK